MIRFLSIPVLTLLTLFFYRAPARTASGIIDPDYYWHLQYGDWILDNGRLPTVDFWSWTFDGKAYKLTQWLGEVVMALANRAGGEMGTSILAAVLLTLTITCSYRAARCFLDNRLAALAVAVGCNAILVSLPCRPHQFTHLGLACMTWIISIYQTNGDKKVLYWIPSLFALWVNLHGGYAVGLVYLWMVIGAIAADKFINNQCSEIWNACKPLFFAALLAVAATLINPYGWGAWLYAIDIASLKSSSAGLVDEWAATTIKNDIGFNYFIVTSAMFVCMASSAKRPPVSALLSALALAAVGWTSLRVSIMMTVLMVPLLAAWLRHTPFYAMAFDGKARRYDVCIKPAVAALVLVATLGLSLAVSFTDKTTSRYVTANLPEQELAFIQDNRLQGNILNTPDTGGYLIRKANLKVALDTRFDLYGDRAFFEFLLATKGALGWKAYLQNLDPDILLTSNHTALRQLASDSGLYRTVFAGQRYSVMVKAFDRPDLKTVTTEPNKTFLDALL